MGRPGDAIVGRLRARLCERIRRRVEKLGMDFPSPRACMGWVVEGIGAFDHRANLPWLDRFLPLPVKAEPRPTQPPVSRPQTRVRGRTLQEWWTLLYPRLLVWGRQRGWSPRSEGFEGVLGQTYLESDEAWPWPDRVFDQDGDPLPWVVGIASNVALRHRHGRQVSLLFDPPDGAAGDPGTVGTATHVPDRAEMAHRVRGLSAELPTTPPDLGDRLDGRGTLELLVVADQFEVILLMDRCDREWWCRRVLAGGRDDDVAAALGKTVNNMRKRFSADGGVRDTARQRLADLWCRPAAGCGSPPPAPPLLPAPSPAGAPHE
jgi:hypothetical protein